MLFRSQSIFMIYDQNGVLRNKDQKEMTHQDIMNMDWLLDNVTGTIPSMDSLIDKAKTVVELKGVEEKKL